MAVIVPILSTFNDKGIKSAVREFQTAKTQIQKFSAVGKVFEGVGRSLTKNLTVPLAAAGVGIFKLTQLAADLEETQNKVNVLFGEAATEIQKFASTASTSLGQTTQQALDAAAGFAAFGNAAGLTGTELTTFSTDFVKLATDMASFNNTTVDEAILALGSGLRGEYLPLRRFNVLLDEATLKSKAMEMGLIDTTKNALTPQQKVLAAQAAIMEQTIIQQGDFERTSGSLVNQQKILQAQLKDVATELGVAFVPVLQKIITIIRERVVPALERFGSFIRGISPDTIVLIAKIAGLVAVLGPLLVVIGKTIIGISKLQAALKLMGITMGLTPIGLMALAVVGLGLAINEIVKKFGGWREAMRLVGNGIISLAEGAVNLIIDYLNHWVKGINLIIRGLNAIGFDFKEVGELGQVEFNRISKAAYKSQQNIAGMSDYAKELAGVATKEVAPGLQDVSMGLNETSEKASKAKDKVRELKEAMVALKQEAVNKLEESLRSAQNQLDAARDKFNNFKDSIKGNITGLIDFQDAAEGENFLEGLIGQASDATAFANKVKELIRLGLSERGITEVLNAGYEAGTKIADQLIAGGQTVVQQVNALLESISTIAEQVGDAGAREFYLAGVTQGESLVNGILSALAGAQKDLLKAQSALATGGAIANVGGTLQQALRQEAISSGNQKALDLINKVTQGGTGKVSAAELKRIQAAGIGGGLVHPSKRLAKGGIVMGPTTALIGEAGPEAVVPLSGSRANGMGTTYNITINAGIGTDGSAVGRQIVEAIKKYERSSGQVFARA